MRLGRKHRTRLAEIDDSVVSEPACVGPAPNLHPGQSVAGVWLGFAAEVTTVSG